METNKELEIKLKENTEWGEEDTEIGLSNCDYCLQPFINEPLRLWKGLERETESSQLDNLFFHQECKKIYQRIKVLVFRQCLTEKLEKELEGRKWLMNLFVNVRKSLKLDEEEETQAQILQNRFF
jgi:hypothetical protein